MNCREKFHLNPLTPILDDSYTTTTSFGVDVTTVFASEVEGFPFTTPERPLLFIISLILVSVAQDSPRGG